MAEIIEFPHKPFLWKFTTSSSRIYMALRFLFNNMRRLPTKPKRMIVIYEMENDESNSIYYLNIGYTSPAFVKAFHEVLQDVERTED